MKVVDAREISWVVLPYHSVHAAAVTRSLHQLSEDQALASMYRNVFNKSTPKFRAAWTNGGVHHEMLIRKEARTRKSFTSKPRKEEGAAHVIHKALEVAPVVVAIQPAAAAEATATSSVDVLLGTRAPQRSFMLSQMLSNKQRRLNRGGNFR